MIRALISAGAVAGVLAFAPMAADAQFLLGPEVAWNDDADLGVGAGVEFDLPSLYPGIAFHGDFLWFFPDFGDFFEINTNLTYDFPLEDASVVPFGIAGLNIGRFSGEGDSDFSDTELGLNLGAGVKFNMGSFQPRAGVRAVLGGTETATVFLMLPFAVGN